MAALLVERIIFFPAEFEWKKKVLFLSTNMNVVSWATSQASVVQKVHNAIHWLNLYPVDMAIGFPEYLSTR